MKNQIATTIEQSRRLLSCGVDPRTADMCWTQRTHRIDGTPIKKSHQKANLWLGYPCKRYLEDDEQRIDTPAWSLSALCSLIPSKVTAPHANTPCYFRLYHMPDKWRAMYHDGKKSGDAEDYYWQCASEQDGTDPIEVCVMMIEWLSIEKISLNKIEE